MEAVAEITAAVKNVPALRFPEFEGEWKEDDFGKVVEKSKAKYNPEKEAIGYPCIELESLSQETGILLETFNSKEQLSIKNKFKQGEVLYGKLRPYLKKYLIAPFDGVCSSEIWVFNGKKVSNEFLYRLIQGNKFNYFASISSGSKMPRADWEYVSSSPVSYPTKAEQQKIASFLSAAENKIQQLSKKKDLLKKYKKGVMQQIFSQQIRFKDDNGNDFPEWEGKTLGEVSTNVMYGLNSSAIEFDGKHKYIRITDIDESSREFTPKPLTSPEGEFDSKYRLSEGDLLFARTGASVGKSYLYKESDGEVYFAGFLIRFTISKANPYFVYCQTLTRNYNKWILVMSMRSGQPGVNAEEYKSLNVMLPCLEEQNKIANFLISIDNKINSTSKQLEQTQQFKKGLLQQMFV